VVVWRLIPLFLTYNALNWIDTLLPLFVPFFFGNAFAIFHGIASARQTSRFPSAPRSIAGTLRISASVNS
jgi:ABC-type glycerol-3-phosphate transport system permease component